MVDRRTRTTDHPPDSLSEIVAATRNADKLALLGRLAGRRHELQPLPAGIEVGEPEADLTARSDALNGIARAKAISVSVALGGVQTIASDGGLLVPGLGDRWRPARTRRFAGPDAINRDRAARLLALAAGLTGDQRRLGWREVVAIAEAGRVIATFTAEATPGWLVETLPADQQDDGQGFWVPCLWRSSAEASGTMTDGGADHWHRLALMVGAFLDGLASSRRL